MLVDEAFEIEIIHAQKWSMVLHTAMIILPGTPWHVPHVSSLLRYLCLLFILLNVLSIALWACIEGSSLPVQNLVSSFRPFS
jgi:hypothetical protein